LRQFDVYPNPSTAARAFAPYVVVLQSHHIGGIDTVVVAPLVNDAQPNLAPLDVPVSFNGEELTIAVAELGGAERSQLRRRAGDLLLYEDAVRRALDRLFTGF
jgi:toxin CcdB